GSRPEQAAPGRRRRVQGVAGGRLRRRLLLARLPAARDMAQGKRRVLAREDPGESGPRPRHRRAPACRWLEGRARVGTRAARAGCRTDRDDHRGVQGAEPRMTTRLATVATVLSSTAPEPGQLVEVRRRQWIVSDVDAAAVSPEL